MTVYGNWKRLNYNKPKLGQKCEWILFEHWGLDKGVGCWFDNDNNLDDNPLRCSVRGFVDERGTFISDPKRTIWRHYE